MQTPTALVDACHGVPSADLLQVVLDALQEGILLLDARGAIVCWNDWMARMSGVDCAQAQGRTLPEVFPTMACSRVIEAVDWALRRGLPSFLSASLNKVPFPLKHEGAPIEQNLYVTPLDVPGRERQCLIRIVDVTSVVEKEHILRRRAQKMKELAMIDPLTGVANRRRFEAALIEETRRHRRRGLPLSLLMLDVDHFKAYNDTYGHLAGDECLAALAAAIATVVRRAGDLLGRLGGEEFAVLLPETDRAGACAVAEDILTAVRELALPHSASSSSDRVTLSIGVACVERIQSSAACELMAVADTALYEAKNGGRNRYVCYQVDSECRAARCCAESGAAPQAA